MVLCFCQSILGEIMAVIIKVLDSGSKQPKSGVRVSYSSSRGQGSEKFTDSSGCVSYMVDPVKAVVTIKGNQRSEQFLKNGENVFYIWIAFSRWQNSRLFLSLFFYAPFFPSHSSRLGIEATENFVSFSSPWIRIQTGASPISAFSR